MADASYFDHDSPNCYIRDIIRELRYMEALLDANQETNSKAAAAAKSPGSVTEASSGQQAASVSAKVAAGVRRTMQLLGARDAYALKMTSPCSSILQEIEEFTKNHNWIQLRTEGTTKGQLRRTMLSGALEGQFLKFLTRVHGARRVLEVSMLTGYSALSMAEALPGDGVVVTCEMEPYLVKVAQGFFDRSPHGSKIHIRQGTGKEVLSALQAEGQTFDLIFLDADRVSYMEYFKIVMEGLLAPGGTLVIDNAFTYGISYSQPSNDPVANPMGHFISHVVAHPGVTQVLLPVRDGILLVRRNQDFGGEPAISARG